MFHLSRSSFAMLMGHEGGGGMASAAAAAAANALHMTLPNIEDATLQGPPATGCLLQAVPLLPLRHAALLRRALDRALPGCLHGHMYCSHSENL
jgi:hypothetical protein